VIDGETDFSESLRMIPDSPCIDALIEETDAHGISCE
jgi:hypothetical protein